MSGGRSKPKWVSLPLLLLATAAAPFVSHSVANAEPAHAATIELSPVVRVSSVDEDTNDGSIEFVIWSNDVDSGALFSNGDVDRRIALEFEVPSGVRIDRALLRFVVRNPEGVRQVKLHGYRTEGGGSTRPGPAEERQLGYAIVKSVGSSPLAFDVTTFVNDLLLRGETRAGFIIHEQFSGGPSLARMVIPPTSTPVLGVDYTPLTPMWLHGTAPPGSFIIVFVGGRPCGGAWAEPTAGLWARAISLSEQCAPRLGEAVAFSLNGAPARSSIEPAWAPGASSRIALSPSTHLMLSPHLELPDPIPFRDGWWSGCADLNCGPRRPERRALPS